MVAPLNLSLQLGESNRMTLFPHTQLVGMEPLSLISRMTLFPHSFFFFQNNKDSLRPLGSIILWNLFVIKWMLPLGIYGGVMTLIVGSYI